MGEHPGWEMCSENQTKIEIADSFKPQGQNVNIREVYIGCTLESSSQSSTSKATNEKGQDNTRCLTNSEIENKIKRNLIRRFRKIKLPTLSWLQTSKFPIEKYTKLELQCKDNSNCNENIELQNMFEVDKNVELRRILIESQPGFGKTTLMHKITSDWVNREDYISHYKFTILVILKWLRSKSLKTYLVQMIGIDEGDADADYIWNLINTEETLLILDGLDEIGEEDREQMQEILIDLKNKYMMTIIATSRVGLYRCSEPKLHVLYEGVAIGDEFWDKKISVLGIIGDIGRRAFFQNFLRDDESELLARLCSITNSKEEMFKSPLLLILLVYILRDNEVSKIATNTDLYKNLVDCIIRRNVSKSNPNIVLKKFSVFDESYKFVVQSWHGRELFYTFGEMSVNHILNNNLQFDNSEITSSIYELGFLSKHEKTESFETDYFYEGFHLTIVEFAIAFYFMEEYRRNEQRFSHDIIKKINEICMKKGEFSTVIPFLCGLLEKDVAFLFDRLSRHRIFYWTKLQLIINVLRECVLDDYIEEYFLRFCPPRFIVDEFVSTPTLSNQHLMKNLKCLVIISPYLWDIEFPIIVDTIIVRLEYDPFSRKESCTRLAKNIQCKSIIFVMQDSLQYIIMEQNLKLLKEIACECKHLYIALPIGELDIGIKKYLDDGKFHGLKLDYLSVLLSVERDMNVNTRMIESIEIKRLGLKFRKVSDANTTAAVSLVSTAASLNYITSMLITPVTFNENLRLDFGQITKNEEKEWELLRIENTIVECEYPLKHKPNIKSISINPTTIFSTLENEVNALLSITPTCLHCNYRVLEDINRDERATSWDGWNSVVKLVLTIGDSHSPGASDFSDSHCLSVFAKFLNVKTVRLEIISRLDETTLLNFIQSLKSMVISRLEIRWNNECYIDNFVLKIHETISIVEFVVVEIVFEKLKDARFNFDVLNAILKCESKISFRLIFSDRADVDNFIFRNFLELQNFSSDFWRECCEFKKPISYCIHGFQYFYTSYYVLQLTLYNSSDT